MRKLFVLAMLCFSSLAFAQVSTPPMRISNEGSRLALRFNTNFIGSGIDCVDNAGSKRTDCTITSGGGSGTVTSIATSSPLGGGTITGTGTLTCATCVVTGGSTFTGANTFSGTQLGTYTLGGTVTIASPTITTAVTLPAAVTEPANVVYTGGSSSTNTTAFTNTQNVANGASSTAFKLINTTTLSTSGHSFLSLFNGGSAAGNEMFRLSMEATGFTISANPSTAGSFAGGNFNLRSNDSQWYIGAGAGIGSFRTGIYLGVNVASAIELWANGTNTAIATSAAFKPGVTGITLGAASLPWKGVVAGAAAASLPTCDATTRGTMFPVFAANGASDTFQVCMKAAADTYAFRTVFTAP